MKGGHKISTYLQILISLRSFKADDNDEMHEQKQLKHTVSTPAQSSQATLGSGINSEFYYIIN